MIEIGRLQSSGCRLWVLEEHGVVILDGSTYDSYSNGVQGASDDLYLSLILKGGFTHN